jgi:hypothetical protein
MGLAPQAKGATPPGQLEGAPSSAAEFVICNHTIEVLFKELKGVVGLGQHQVTKHVERVERSVAVAIMADLLLLMLRAKDIPADRPWSAFGLQRALAWEVMQAQCERAPHQMARKWLQLGNAA